MNVQELRESKEYNEAMKKIKGYKKGFKFTIKYYLIPKPKANALKIILQDSIESGLLKSIRISLNLAGEQTEEEFIRL